MRVGLAWLLLTLVIAGAMAMAGGWQRQRGIEKERLLADFELAMRQPATDLADAMTRPSNLPRRVAGGLQRVSHLPWLLLDNQRRGDRVGTRALGVYRSAGRPPLLVDFGWNPWPADRNLPPLPPLPEYLDARGLLVALPGQGLRLAPNPSVGDAGEPVLLTYLDPSELAAAVGSEPYPGLLRLDPALPIGFTRDLDALPNTLPPERHYGYALQWFGMSAAVVVIYLVLMLRKWRS